MNRLSHGDTVKKGRGVKRGGRERGKRKGGEEKRGEPVQKLLTAPFQLTSCAPDSGANPDWLDH